MELPPIKETISETIPSKERSVGPSLSKGTRLVVLVVALGLAGLLATAAMLQPSDRGYGTHTQLGLSDCFVLKTWGVRCPSCGMTTSWSRLMHGNVGGAVGANAGGVLLALLALFAVPWLLASSLVGRWCYLRPAASLLFPVVSVLLLVLLLDWTRHTGWPLFVNHFFAGS